MARPRRRDGNGHPRHRLREAGRRDRSSAWTSTRRPTEIARENVLINQVEDRVEIADLDVATLTEPFHLIVANLTAKILIKLRPHLDPPAQPRRLPRHLGDHRTEQTGHRGPFPRRFLSAPPPHHRKGVGLLCPEERGRPAVTIPRLYLPHALETGDVCAATAEQARYLKTVLRMQGGRSPARLQRHGLGVRGGHPADGGRGLPWRSPAGAPLPADGIEITLCQAIPKAEKMDGIIRHATELGAGGSSPSSRSGRSPAGRRKSFRRSGSAGRRSPSRPPVSAAGPTFRRSGRSCRSTEMLRAAPGGGLSLIPWEEETATGIREVLRDPVTDGMKEFLLVDRSGGGIQQGRNRPGPAGGFPVRQSGKTGAPRGDGGAGGPRHPPVRKGRASAARRGEVRMTDKRFGGFWRRFWRLLQSTRSSSTSSH